jgi:hypothetical protein
MDAPLVSVVIPSLNEEITIGEFVDSCHEGAERAGVATEVLIVDSSTDRTAEIALAHGARVLAVPKRGLGRAYTDAIPFIRGQYVLMGDADLTYDFRDFASFIQMLRAGYEFVMGSRFRGHIEPGAMPLHHRYFGTPLTTWILNLVYGTHHTDIHCGMRGMTLDALVRMRLQSQGWQYASEMVIKSAQLGLRTTEVPINFYKDRPGRTSHLKRGGWLTPWKCGWDNVRVMFVSGAQFFLMGPGVVAALLGLPIALILSFGPVTVGPFTLTAHSQALAISLSTIGLTCIYMGIIASVANDLTGLAIRHWRELFTITRSITSSALLVAVGLTLNLLFVGVYFDRGFSVLAEDAIISHLALTGLFLLVIGMLTFGFTLVLQEVSARIQDVLEMSD